MKALAVLLLVLAFVPAALAHGEGEEEPSLPGRDFALQALAILQQGGSHELAMQKLELALESTDTSGVDISSVRLARAALSQERVGAARSALEQAFAGQDSHVIGVLLRPRMGAAQVAALVAGAIFLVLAALGLAHRSRRERRATPR